MKNTLSVFVLFTILSLISLAASRAEEWGASLGPSFPEEVGAAGNFAPATISGSRSAKKLPARLTERGGRPVAFDIPPEPTGTIIPQSFFDDEPVPSANTSPAPAAPTASMVPKTLKKKARTIETDVTPEPADASVGEFSFSDDASFSQETIVSYGDEYNDPMAAMNGYYVGPMIMKPFGTGILDNLTVFGGTTGFKNCLDAGRNGNFGFQEGINWAGPATPQCTVSAQLGFRAIQSNVTGHGGVSNKSYRNQYFVTAGLFKRDLCCPVQGGVAFDWMEDDFYGKVKVRQFRCELSVRTFSNLEYGFLGGCGVSKKGTPFIDYREDPTGQRRYGIEAHQYYLLFLRKHFCAGGVAEFRIGATDRGDIILGASSEFPMTDHLTLNGGFSSMIPEQGRGHNGYRQESWELSVGFVYYFRGGASSKPCNPCRAMFDVAGNGSFFHRIVRK